MPAEEGTELVKARFEYCLLENLGKGKVEARRGCVNEVLNELVGTEIIAQRWYGELKEIPEFAPFKDKIDEVQGDEADHEGILKGIFSAIMEQRCPYP